MENKPSRFLSNFISIAIFIVVIAVAGLLISFLFFFETDAPITINNYLVAYDSYVFYATLFIMAFLVFSVVLKMIKGIYYLLVGKDIAAAKKSDGFGCFLSALGVFGFLFIWGSLMVFVVQYVIGFDLKVNQYSGLIQIIAITSTVKEVADLNLEYFPNTPFTFSNMWIASIYLLRKIGVSDVQAWITSIVITLFSALKAIKEIVDLLTFPDNVSSLLNKLRGKIRSESTSTK